MDFNIPKMASWTILVALVAVASAQHVINENCIQDCSAEPKDPVCGNNKITYDNECLLKEASCFASRYYSQRISVKHKGACTYAETTDTEVLKHCNDLCDESRDYRCGSDGVVYDNKCTFTRAKCEAIQKNQTLFVVTLSDKCPVTRKADCTKYRLDVNDIAIEDPAAFRPVCPYTRMSVCVSDGHTYVHECQMCARMARDNVDLTILKDGNCGQ